MKSNCTTILSARDYTYTTHHVVCFHISLTSRVQDLELAIDRMKQQQENMQRKLKDETEQKAKIEVS